MLLVVFAFSRMFWGEGEVWDVQLNYWRIGRLQLHDLIALLFGFQTALTP